MNKLELIISEELEKLDQKHAWSFEEESEVEFYPRDAVLGMLNTIEERCKEPRVYVINLIESDIDFRGSGEEAIIEEAERLGSIYSLEGFEHALNSDELSLNNSYVYFSHLQRR